VNLKKANGNHPVTLFKTELYRVVISEVLDHFIDRINARTIPSQTHVHRPKNRFVTATKLGTTNKNFVAATKNFAALTKRFVDRTKHFVVVTKCFCYPYFNK